MKFLIGILLICAVVGCGGSSLKEGVVKEKQINPAHDDTIIIPIYAGQSCYTINKVQYCNSRYNYIPWVVHYDTSYELKLEYCANSSKCKHGNAYVDEDTYKNTKIGDYYSRVKGDNKLQYDKLHKKI